MEIILRKNDTNIDHFPEQAAFKVAKADSAKKLVFGWAQVTKSDGKLLLDRQADTFPDEWSNERAAYNFVLNSRMGSDEHDDVKKGASTLVESMFFTDEKCDRLGLPDDFPRGWWVGFKVHDEEVWKSIESGDRTGFSVGGRGIRSEVDLSDEEIVKGCDHSKMKAGEKCPNCGKTKTEKATASTIRDSLSGAAQAAGVFSKNVSAYYIDHDEVAGNVYMETYSQDTGSHTWGIPYTEEGGNYSFGNPFEVRRVVNYDYVAKSVDVLDRAKAAIARKKGSK